jgi:hypothetical protein
MLLQQLRSMSLVYFICLAALEVTPCKIPEAGRPGGLLESHSHEHRPTRSPARLTHTLSSSPSFPPSLSPSLSISI